MGIASQWSQAAKKSPNSYAYGWSFGQSRDRE
jgi:hypothetical protein